MKSRALLAGTYGEFITENGCPNGGSNGYGIIKSKAGEKRSVAVHKRVSKAADRHGLPIGNARIQEVLRAPYASLSSSSLPVASPKSRSERSTSSMAAARVAVVELLARALAATVVNGDPSSYEEVMACPQRKHWKGAIREECNSIL